MKIGRLIYPLKRDHLPESAGNKARNLKKLMKLGLNIPSTVVCDWRFFEEFTKGDENLISTLETRLTKLIDLKKVYAIRSSTNIEDSSKHSYAGQFDSILNVNGINEIIEAIKSVWRSANASNLKVYQQRNQIPEQEIRMAVIIQEMVPPKISGVALSRNPVTGANEVIVEAVEGVGTKLMQNGEKPYRWIQKFGHWIEKDEEFRFSDAFIEEIVRQVKGVSKALGYPIDMEWVYDGKDVYWVQIREITSLSKLDFYSNYLSQEMMPGMLKPLSFHIGAPLMSSAILTWLGEILGDINIQPKDLVKMFYYRVYFNMGSMGKIFKKFGFPAESIELLVGTLPPGVEKPKMKPTAKTFIRLPAVLLFLLKNIRLRRKLRSKLVSLENDLQIELTNNLGHLTPAEIYHKINDHQAHTKKIAYLTSLSMFFLSMYNRMLKRLLAKRGVEFSDFYLTENMPELDDFYPSILFNELHQIYHSYHPNKQNEISSTKYNNLNTLEGIDDFIQTFELLLNRFGHLSDSGNDFSKPPWRETPDDLLMMIQGYDSKNQSQSKKVRLSDLQNQKQAGPFFMYSYRRARDFHFLREKASNLYTKSKVMFRDYFLVIGEYYTQQEIINDPEDIFYLTPDQIEALIYKQKGADNIKSLVTQHKHDMRLYKDKQLPTVIYGNDPPNISDAPEKTLFGVPASIGSYTGKVCVIKNIKEFTKLEKGEVLVIPYSDVTWSPLFASAGALVAESGGLLSHGSIIAREYGIPAIVSVENATKLEDGCMVTVDAHQGLVHIIDS